MSEKIKIIVTLGPATKTERDLKLIKDKGIDFVRINMSHSSIEDLKYFISLAKKIGIPFIIDTEGSQVRTGRVKGKKIEFGENQDIKIYNDETLGDESGISLHPGSVVNQLEKGDLIQMDFDTLTLRVTDTSTAERGYITAKTLAGGIVGENKAVIFDLASGRKIELPPLSEKDYQSIKIGLEEGIGYIAASFMRSGKAVEEVRRATQNTMRIISKVECIDALENLGEIIDKSDFLLIDRGDLSKEIPVERIPFTQKIIISEAKKKNVGVFVATNLLETMIEQKKPTRAEVHDVIMTIVDGAYGLTLAAETAIGKYPFECINMLNSLVNHAGQAMGNETAKDDEKNNFIEDIKSKNYLLDFDLSSSLVVPHGGKLMNRFIGRNAEGMARSLPKLKIDENRQRDVEQIALGVYSPLEGFMGKEDLFSVLDRMRLRNNVPWPLPVFLDVSEMEAEKLSCGEKISLVNEKEEIVGILNLEEKFKIDKREMASKIYSTDDPEHPGVKMTLGINPILLGGKIELIRRMDNEYKEYELTPRQARRLFEARGWVKVVGFHTRNVIHRAHEYIQLEAMDRSGCDGLFVHPIVGKKKAGDFKMKYIIKSYELMMEHFYPKNKIVFGAFSSYSRYAGPREAIFTALCRKNFGCSHFIVGRDHTGVKDYYHPKASHNIFDRFPDLGIVPIRFDQVFFSKSLGKHVHLAEGEKAMEDDQLHLSGTEARKIFERGEIPPYWFIRPEISQVISDGISKGEEVFVR
jgi:pyruvate kinase